MKQSDDRTGAKFNIFKPESNIQKHEDRCNGHGNHGVLFHFFGYTSGNLFRLITGDLIRLFQGGLQFFSLFQRKFIGFYHQLIGIQHFLTLYCLRINARPYRIADFFVQTVGNFIFQRHRNGRTAGKFQIVI